MSISADNRHIMNHMNPAARQVSLGEVLGQVVDSGIFTTVAGSATQTIAVPAALLTDSVQVTLNTPGASPVTVLNCKVSVAGTVQVIMSANPAADHKLNYLVIRAFTSA